MKKLLAIVVLGLLWCNVGFADIAFTCESIISPDQKWNFSFIRIDSDKTWVKIKGDYPLGSDGYGSSWSDKKYAEEKDHKLFWYEIFKDSEFKKIKGLHIDPKNEQGSALILHLLTPPNNDVNYLSIIIFFNADYKKEELNELEKSYIFAKNEPDKDVYSFIPWEFFFDEAHNFYSTRFAWGKESWDKGNWANVTRAVCKEETDEKKKEHVDAGKEDLINGLINAVPTFADAIWTQDNSLRVIMSNPKAEHDFNQLGSLICNGGNDLHGVKKDYSIIFWNIFTKKPIGKFICD